jgi:hypothetical protein
MPSGRTTYRTYDDFNNEMQALATANPGFVEIKTAPYRSVEGREITYLEITNNVTLTIDKGQQVNLHPGPNGYLQESWTLTCQTTRSSTPSALSPRTGRAAWRTRR